MSSRLHAPGPLGAGCAPLPRAVTRFAVAVAVGIAAVAAQAGESGRFASVSGDPAEPASDLSIQHMSRQPASSVMCAYGYWAEKSGDHETANAIFDRCIEAGYAGAMIWKALLYEEGNGVPQDSAKAAALFKRAAESGDPGYATLGKLHYATALHLGKGVPRDEAEALKWFRAAAEEGDPDAQEFLRTGDHTADRDLQGRSVGAQSPRVQGQRLDRLAPAAPLDVPGWFELVFSAALVAAFALGLLRQARNRVRSVTSRPSPLVAEGA